MNFFQKATEWVKDKYHTFLHGDETNGSYYSDPEQAAQYGYNQEEVPDAQQESGKVLQMDAYVQGWQGQTQGQQYQYQPPVQQSGWGAQSQQQAAPQQAQPAPQQAAPQAPDSSYVHVERIVQLNNRNDCCQIIGFLKNRESIIVNMEFIASETERQRCVDLLSGAVFTLDAIMTKFSTHGAYLIAPGVVQVMADDATQRYNGASVRQNAEPPVSQSAPQPQQNPYAYTAPQQDNYQQPAYENRMASGGGYAPNPLRGTFSR